MKKKYLMLLLTTLLSITSAQARPAYPGKRTVTLKDGRQVELTLRGDEHFSFFTDAEGHAYKRIPGAGIHPISLDEVNRKWQPRMAKANARRMTRGVGTASIDLTGKKKGLVILMQFADYSFVTPDANGYYQKHFNQEGLNDDGMASVKDYFKTQSYGQFELDFDVVGPYTAAHSMVYYGGEDGDYNDKNPAELIKEACEAADAEVNFADYDWNSNGEVDQVFVIFAGYGQNYDTTEEGLFSNCLWPHESSLASWGINLKLDGVTIDTYACDSELSGTKGTENEGIGGACHEFSHCLGLPDFYDTQGQNFGMGRWDVMDQGNYNNNSRTPAGYTSYERMFAGWLTPTEINTMKRVEGMKPLAETPEAYILYNEGNRNEYYLLENRQPKGFDAGLPGHGLLVLHVDYDEQTWTMNAVNVNANHQRMAVIPADNALRSTSASYEGDPFPGTSGATQLTNYTTPAATLFNANKDGQKLMSKPIDNIRESEDGLISFVACRPELGIPEPGEGKQIGTDASFSVEWPAVADAVGYEMEVTEIGAAADTPEEALEMEFDFEQTISKTTGLSDIAKKLADYGLEDWSGNKLYTSPQKLRLGTSSTVGYVRTDTWEVPKSSDMTIVVGAALFKAGTPVKGKVRVAFGNKGDQATYDDSSFELTEDGLMVFHFTVRKDLFWIEIRPESCMYLNYLAVYDGTWSKEQLPGRARMKTRSSFDMNYYTTETNSITLTDLNPRNRFVYRLRTIGVENTYSLWSDEHIFSFPAGTVGIAAPSVVQDMPVQVYDLYGRLIGTDKDKLPRGIYIIRGKKVVR